MTTPSRTIQKPETNWNIVSNSGDRIRVERGGENKEIDRPTKTFLRFVFEDLEPGMNLDQNLVELLEMAK